MLPNPNPMTFIVLSLGVSAFILIMLLPAFLELKKPRDAGPRTIMNNIIAIPQLPTIMEDEKPILDQALYQKIAEILVVLPNLEA
ncbi:MAG: hypothetical protein NWE85_03370 [Candidatus Bathyarchaeota archaeon]|nr:hypothetical protein [Candidatus Bathyarchaeota archaeon]